jgi:hypothetical protein
MQNNKLFDAEGLLAKHPDSKERLKWWTEELCQEQPQTFDIVLAVWLSSIQLAEQPLTRTARWRRHRPLRIMALPTGRPPGAILLPGIPRLPHQIRL